MTFSGTKLLPIVAALAAIPAASPAAFQVANPYGAAQFNKESPANALARHVRALAASPRSLPALLGAGNAALELGDTQAALTFFARAEEVAPRDGRAKAGMGSAFVQSEQPQAALKFFAEALTMGVPTYVVAKDRGLVYDVLGDQSRAQADYALVLSIGGDPETERRMALSKAISGDREGALAILEPQVRRHDRAGWRARAFVLALTGDTAEAVKSAAAFMPRPQVSAMEPFLALLPRLNPAEQAMAVHFGRFPQNAALRPETQSAAAAPAPSAAEADKRQPARSRSRSGRSVTRPAGRPEFPSTSDRTAVASSAAPQQPANPAPIAPGPSSQSALAQAQPIQAEPLPAITVQAQASNPQSVPAQPVQTQVQPAQTQTAQNGAVSASPASILPVEIAPSDIALAQLAPAPAASDQPASQAAANEPAPSSRNSIDFADIAAEISAMQIDEAAAERPETPVRASPAQAKVQAPPKPKPAPAKKAEPAKPSEPSRIWVQLAAAQNKNAFPAEFRRIKSKAGKLLSGKTAWTSPLRATNRLLVGPFKTDKEARDLVNELSKLNISSYAWTSEAGQTIEKLPDK
jgi:Flp pilus assembly protein TadD